MEFAVVPESMLVRQSKDLHGSFIDKSELYIGLTVSVNQHSVLVNELAVQKKKTTHP